METARILLIGLTLTLVTAQEFIIPRLRIAAYNPKGLRMVLPHLDGMEFVSVIANINRPVALSDNTGMIKKELRIPKNNRWIVHLADTVVRANDVIHYKLAVRFKGRTYFSGLESFRVKALTPLPSVAAQQESIVWPGVELSAGGGNPPPRPPTNTPAPIRPPSNTPPPFRPPSNTPAPLRPPSNTPGPVRPPSNTPTPSITTKRPVKPNKPAPIRPGQVPQVTNTPTNCIPSVTKVKGVTKCKGELIFEEHFDVFDQKQWQYEVKVAEQPDNEFVIYDSRPENVYIEDGALAIKPTLTDQVYGKPFMTSGTLHLEDCTGTGSGECDFQASYGYVMPAVISGRIRSVFSFQYGKIEVKAMMARGDWLMSNFYLMPARFNFYGPYYNSGQMRLASVRGNRDLQCDDTDYGQTQVDSGIVLGCSEDQIHRELNSREARQGYSNTYHVYKLEWTPDKMVYYVDGKISTTITPPEGGFISYFDEADSNPWTRGSKMAPFDKEFVPVISLSAGGVRDFPDSCVSGGKDKPWKNNNPKAPLHFYQNQSNWANTFLGPLKVDYIKIWAI